jgi:hypothetical protein
MSSLTSLQQRYVEQAARDKVWALKGRQCIYPLPLSSRSTPHSRQQEGKASPPNGDAEDDDDE